MCADDSGGEAVKLGYKDSCKERRTARRAPCPSSRTLPSPCQSTWRRARCPWCLASAWPLRQCARGRSACVQSCGEDGGLFVRISFGIKRYGQFRFDDFGKTLVFLAVFVDPEELRFQEWRTVEKKRTVHGNEVGVRPIDQNFTK